MVNADELLLVARVGRAHGVRGEVHVWPFAADSEVLFEVEAAWLAPSEGASLRPMKVQTARAAQRGVLVKFDEIRDRTAAEALNNQLLYVRKADLPALSDPDEFYHHELIGRSVVTREGAALGAVEEIWDTGGGDVLVVRDRAQDREVLIPFTRQIVDLGEPGSEETGSARGNAAQPIRVDPPEGLLEATAGPIQERPQGQGRR